MGTIFTDRPWILETLACPFDRTKLRWGADQLLCEKDHRFPIEAEIPIFADKPRRELHPGNMGPCVLDPLSPVDPFVNDWIVNTNGNLYWPLRGRLPRYPIPLWPGRFATQPEQILVDLGCGWGRWSLAATNAGYQALGVDIHLDAVEAAHRVSRESRTKCGFLCAEIDKLPFGDGSVDFVFSYSVLQHLERSVVRRALAEASRILKPGGHILVQLPNAYGPISIIQQLKRGYREAKPETFEMRYWAPGQIMELFHNIGFESVCIRSDGFLSQNPQQADLSLLSNFGKVIVRTSAGLSHLANAIPPLTHFSDSLWVSSGKIH